MKVYTVENREFRVRPRITAGAVLGIARLLQSSFTSEGVDLSALLREGVLDELMPLVLEGDHTGIRWADQDAEIVAEALADFFERSKGIGGRLKRLLPAGLLRVSENPSRIGAPEEESAALGRS